MKRIPLNQLKRILRVGDYIGAFRGEFHEVLEVDEYIFSYATSDDRRLFRVGWAETILAGGYYWLPGDLLDSTDTIRKIKAARLKEYRVNLAC